MDSRVPVLYQDHDTILHRRDARVKILLFALLFVYLFVAPTWQWLLLPTALGLSSWL
jgi:energy-coupling factor transport system permease protein